MYAPKQSPCKDCPDRVLGCHDRCEKYQAFDKANKDRNEKIHFNDRLMGDNEIERRKANNYFRSFRK